ncbi:hydroxyethylthiazole kinase [Oxobacter pfennigii]|uniref:Hydroxyethylthiazole kinase n=1 Tax=Oxobacter pfennigii TaxID=36849 RepID=A0A0P8WA99_9CLOT|nr:hydroxyethylthiazole kinase [Oxobacter pfennigii]KPU45542.1 hydroxyethylthiazole kinase [Oxobacter pfennigii]
MGNKVLIDILKCYNERENKTPLVHFITNFVTMNDVANACLYMGGKPVMAHWEQEINEITSAAHSLVLNLGTPDEARIDAIKKAARIAEAKDIPVILDPVGIHVFSVRLDLARYLLENRQVNVLKGNYSEVMAFLNMKSNFIGIDSLEEGFKRDVIEKIKEFSEINKLYIVITGKEDYVFYKDNAVRITNGTPLLSKITGSGCILSAILGTLCAKGNKKDIFSLCVMGTLINSIAGEKAQDKIKKSHEGFHTFKNYYLDELSLVNDDDILSRGRVFYV